MGERVACSKMAPCADVLDSVVRHLVFIYIYAQSDQTESWRCYLVARLQHLDDHPGVGVIGLDGDNAGG